MPNTSRTTSCNSFVFSEEHSITVGRTGSGPLPLANLSQGWWFSTTPPLFRNIGKVARVAILFAEACSGLGQETISLCASYQPVSNVLLNDSLGGNHALFHHCRWRFCRPAACIRRCGCETTSFAR